MRITKVYTKTGDTGETSLATGERVSKASLRVAAYGDVDELNSVIGLARCRITGDGIQQQLAQIQNGLFVVGADLATPLPKEGDRRTDPMRRVSEAEVESLEAMIDEHN